MTHIYIESSIKRLDVKGVTRIYTALSNVKVRTISSLCKMDEEEFTSVKGIGMGLCVAVKEYLEAHGLKFGMTDMEISAYHEAYLAERKHTAQSKQHEKEEKKKMEEIATMRIEQLSSSEDERDIEKVAKAKALIKEKKYSELVDCIGQFGCCHDIWGLKKRILREKYNIIWYSPSEINPNITYD